MDVAYMNDIHQSTNYFKLNFLQERRQHKNRQLPVSHSVKMAEKLSVIHNNSINYEVFGKKAS